MKELQNYITAIKKLCDKNRVKSLYLFGSYANDTYTDNSDIDLIVELSDTDPLEYAEHYFNLKNELRILLKRQIDLLEKKAITNPYLLKQIENSKVMIYAK